MIDADRILDVVLGLDTLSDLPRTGWLLRGVRPCESIADHSFAAGVVAMFLVDSLREEGVALDGEKVLRMALVHDVPEARTGDFPMPVKTPAIGPALRELEDALAARLLPGAQAALWREAEEAVSLEARVVRAADKVQMMAKVLVYERQHRGDLSEFWLNPRNFDDRGIAPASALFDAICARAGKPRPR